MATRERTHESGPDVKDEVQVIGDRVVVNPRTPIAHLRDAEGNVIETVRLSLEVCACGCSFARPGVGYRGDDGWHCKRCGQLHTLDAGAASSTVDHGSLRPDPAPVREFDRRTHRGFTGLVNGDRSGSESLSRSTDRRNRKGHTKTQKEEWT